jgi:hypothetical protein
LRREESERVAAYYARMAKEREEREAPSGRRSNTPVGRGSREGERA